MKFVLFVVLVSIVSGDVRWNFTIDSLWNSVPISDHRPVEISLSSNDDRNVLLIDIDAPFFNNTPPTGRPGPFQGLWNYEVVEMFFLASSTSHYLELEFSPHGHYLVLLLNGRRKMFKELLTLPIYSSRILSTNRWIGHAEIPRAHFPADVDRFNAFAIHGESDNRTYESLYPAPIDSDAPDFHRLDLFRPMDFSLLLDRNDVDGESWKND